MRSSMDSQARAQGEFGIAACKTPTTVGFSLPVWWTGHEKLVTNLTWLGTLEWFLLRVRAHVVDKRRFLCERGATPFKGAHKL